MDWGFYYRIDEIFFIAMTYNNNRQKVSVLVSALGIVIPASTLDFSLPSPKGIKN